MLTRSMGAGFTGKVRLERVFDMQVERETGQMDLRLQIFFGFFVGFLDFAVLFGFGDGNVNNK